MGTLSRFVLGTLAVAVAAVAVVLVVAEPTPTRALAPSAPVTVRATFDRTLVGFADRVNARVVVLLDRRAVDTSRVRVTEDLTPLQTLGPTQVTRAARGPLLTLTYETQATCLDDRCLAPHGPKRLRLRAVQVVVPQRAGGTARVEAAWPVLDVRDRVTAADLRPANPPLRSDVTPPPVHYRVGPATLASVLEVLAAVLAALGVGLAGRQLWVLHLLRQTRAGRLTDIEHALALAREAEARPPADRRRALGLLARLLARRGERLAGAARELAWSAPAPTTDAVEELVTQVEREVNEV